MGESIEEWRPVVGWEGTYEVSDWGRIRSLDREVPCSDGKIRKLAGRVLKLNERHLGYQSVMLSLGNQQVRRQVHRMVLEAFRGSCPEGKECCHNDGNARNNRLSNLRWDTRSANMYDRTAHGTHPNAAKTHCDNGS